MLFDDLSPQNDGRTGWRDDLRANRRKLFFAQVQTVGIFLRNAQKPRRTHIIRVKRTDDPLELKLICTDRAHDGVCRLDAQFCAILRLFQRKRKGDSSLFHPRQSDAAVFIAQLNFPPDEDAHHMIERRPAQKELGSASVCRILRHEHHAVDNRHILRLKRQTMVDERQPFSIGKIFALQNASGKIPQVADDIHFAAPDLQLHIHAAYFGREDGQKADILLFLPQLLRMQHLAASQKLINKQLIASAPLLLQCFAAKPLLLFFPFPNCRKDIQAAVIFLCRVELVPNLKCQRDDVFADILRPLIRRTGTESVRQLTVFLLQPRPVYAPCLPLDSTGIANHARVFHLHADIPNAPFPNTLHRTPHHGVVRNDLLDFIKRKYAHHPLFTRLYHTCFRREKPLQ